MSTKSQQTQYAILEAGVQVITEQGAGQFTLDAVALQANVSKGGLLYHFPSKDALIAAMLAHYLDSFDAKVEQLCTGDVHPHAWLRAFVRATFEETPSDIAIVASQLAAIVTNSDLIAPMRERYGVWTQRALDAGLPSDLVYLVIAATDGYWYAQMFGFNTFDNGLRDTLQQRLLALIDGA
jgi:AcrR family transcriptional regulator